MLSASSYSSFDSNVSYKNLGKNVYSNPELKKTLFPKIAVFSKIRQTDFILRRAIEISLRSLHLRLMQKVLKMLF